MNSTYHRELDPVDQISFLVAQLGEAQKQITNLQNQLKAKDQTIADMKEAHKRGEASAVLRNENNFPMIDSVLLTIGDAPFKFAELFEKWSKLVGANLDDKVAKDAKSQMQIMLTKLGVIEKTGSRLYRINKARIGIFTNADELGWSTSTYLEPKKA